MFFQRLYLHAVRLAMVIDVKPTNQVAAPMAQTITMTRSSTPEAMPQPHHLSCDFASASTPSAQTGITWLGFRSSRLGRLFGQFKRIWNKYS